MYQRIETSAQQPPHQVRPVSADARNAVTTLLALQRSVGNTAVQRLLVQRRQVDVGSARSVGTTPGPAVNTREDVIAVMDRMHVAWHLSNSDYAAEYPVVADQPPSSVVATSRIPRTLAALDRAEKVDWVPAAVAQAILGTTLSGGVGPGEKNARADVLALQHALHAAWDLQESGPLAFSNAVAEVPAIDPVDPARLVVTRQAIRGMHDRFLRGFPGGGKPQTAGPSITAPSPVSPIPTRSSDQWNTSGVSWELTDAPAASTPRERVAAWLRTYRRAIEDAEARHGVDRRAIAGAIAWEALQNVIGKPNIRLWVGPGKVHVTEWKGKSSAEETEQLGYLPQRSEQGRKAALGDPVGAITYIAAIMQASAEAADAGHYNLRGDPPILCYLYNAKSPSWSQGHFGPGKKESPQPLGYSGSPMAVWVADSTNLAWLTAQVGAPGGALLTKPRGY